MVKNVRRGRLVSLFLCLEHQTEDVVGGVVDCVAEALNINSKHLFFLAYL